MNMQLAYRGMALATIACSLVFGCGKTSDTGGAESVASEHHNDDGHDHDGHDHGSAGHSHVGPHDGHLIELGSNEAFHAELLHDDSTHRVTVHILDGKAKNSVAISQPELLINIVSNGNPKQYKLAAVAQENEPNGMASCFQVEDVALCTALDASDCRGRLAVNIEGKQYVGEIEHHDHEAHDHATRGDHQYK
jgi:hypothetical protein